MDLRREPIEVRKATLASILRKSRPGVRLNEHLEHPEGLTVFQHACKMGLEGIVSKRPTGEIIGACFGRRRSSRQLTIKKPSQCSVPCLSEPSLGFRASSAPTSVRPDWHLVSLRRPPGESETPFDFTR